jgi:hypothetical protein
LRFGSRDADKAAYQEQQVQVPLKSDAYTTHASTFVKNASQLQEQHLRKYLRCRELQPPANSGSLSWLCGDDLLIKDDLYVQEKVDYEK